MVWRIHFGVLGFGLSGEYPRRSSHGHDCSPDSVYNRCMTQRPQTLRLQEVVSGSGL